jgi:subtilisin family serine protease
LEAQLRRSIFCALFLAASVASAAEKLDARIFAGKGPEETASFLVVLRDAADLSAAAALTTKEEKGRYVFDALTAHAELTQAPLRARLEAAGVPFRSFFLVNMIEVRGRRDLALELAGRDDVSAVAANRPSAPLPALLTEDDWLGPAAAASAVEPNIARIRAPEVWSRGFTGQGIVVAVADTGFVWDHPALRQQYRGTNGSAVSHDYNWHDAIHAAPGNPCGGNSVAPCDDSGHGTSVAGVIVGAEGVNQIGVAPGARLIGCRNMDRGVGTPATYTECFQFFLAPTDRNSANPRPELAPHVINNSWGCPPDEGCTDPNVLRTVVEVTRAAGIAVVMSAGNTGAACGTVQDPPAIYEAAFAVGASSMTDGIASFSARGPVMVDGSGRLKPDVVAPGVGIRTAAGLAGYGGFSGTSAAAPHVTGAIALLQSAVPALRGAAAVNEDLLKRSALPLPSGQDCGSFSGSSVPNPIFGWGRIDVANALNMASPVAREGPRSVTVPRAAPRTVPLRP